MGFEHESAVSETVVWLTPPSIIEALGPFDLDPCSPEVRPFETAARYYTEADDGLAQPWSGTVWMNPPYGRGMELWMQRIAEHGDGIALIFARTETKTFFDWIWDQASAMVFIKGRVRFHRPDGTQAAAAGAPSVLIAYGDDCAERLRKATVDGTVAGKYIDLRRN